MKYDIIRFFEDGRKKLVMANVEEKIKDEWVNSPKTKKAGKWFDGFTASHKTTYKCQLGKAMYPSNYTPDDLPKYPNHK